MMNREEIELQTWEYVDGTCNEADRQRIAHLVVSDPVWKAAFTELSVLHGGIAGSIEMEEPSLRFTKNVMEAVAAEHVAPATGRYINKSIIRGIAAFFILTITAVLVYAFATSKASPEQPGLLSQLTVPSLDFGTIFNSTFVDVVLAVNVVLALVLGDMVLRRKKTKYSH